MKTFFLTLFIACCLAASAFGGKINGRIIGGDFVLQGEYPYQVSIQVVNDHICGGSILNGRWILTAGRCIKGIDKNVMTVLIGTNYVNRGGKRYSVAKLIPHPELDLTARKNDIGLIKLSETIVYSELVQPIYLPLVNIEKSNNDINATVSGWGVYENVEPWRGAPYLRRLHTQLMNTEDCKSYNKNRVLATNICTINPVGRGVCHLDLGNPVVVGNVQVGITSFIISQCADGNPDVHTRVWSYLDWISNHIRNDEDLRIMQK